MVVLYMFALFPIYMLATHIVPHAIDMGIPEGVAAGALGLIGATSIAGRLMGGGAAEKLGWTKSMALSCFLSGASVFWLIAIHNAWMLYVFVIAYGLFYGARVPLTASRYSWLLLWKLFSGFPHRPLPWLGNIWQCWGPCCCRIHL